MGDIANWVGSKLVEGLAITGYTVIATDRLRLIRRPELQPVVIAVFSVKRLAEPELVPLVNEQPPVDFVVNIPKDGVIDGSAYVWAAENGVGIGGYGDLCRALTLPDMGAYEHRDIMYIERILIQHRSIKSFERLDNRRYLIHRPRKAPIVAIFLADYELTANAVRTARDRFGQFDEVVLSNPSGTSTADAEAAARDMGSVIYTFAEFRARLRRK